MYTKITFEKIIVRNSSLPIIKIRCLFDLFTEKKIQQTPNFNLISPTKMNMKTKQWENINTVTKKKPPNKQLKRNKC